MINAISIDVEDYFQVAALAKVAARDKWETMPSRVEANTHRILKIFADNNIKCTFFILGWVADRYPQLVKDIDQAGHEVASHGYSHQLIYKQTPQEFQQETIRSKELLQDLVQKPVLGYRAASYSITRRNLWALDILAEAGFQYDSSIFPVRHDNYGIPDAPREPHVLTTPAGHKLVEYPPSTYKVFNYHLPVAGGGYFRLYPYSFTRFVYKRLNAQQTPVVFYLHPWEVDPEQPRFDGASWLSRFRHYNNLDRCEARLVQLLNDFEFATIETVLQELKLLPNDSAARAA